MGVFAYEAMNQTGQEVKDEIDASSAEDALAKIRGLGLFPTRIREKGAKKKGAAGAAGKKKKGMNISFGGAKPKHVTQFTRQLSTLQDAGLPILRSLSILEEQQKPGPLKNALRGVHEDVEGGATLSEAMGKHPKAFDRLYVNMVAAGETGGVLDVILLRLADFMEKAQKLKAKVKGAMIYPTLVMGFAVGVVTMIMIVVIPKFKDIFGDFDATMPRMTELLIATSEWFVTGMPPGWVIVGLGPIAVLLLLKLIRQSKGGRFAVDTCVLKIPIVGQILSKTSIARFCRTLGTLVNAGVPILEAITITKETAGNEVYARALGNIHDSIREGESFAGPLRSSKVCDGIVVNMIAVGEETGEMDKMLVKIADNYDEEVDVLVGALISVLEPVMVLVLGVVVGAIVIALFLPLVALLESISA